MAKLLNARSCHLKKLARKSNAPQKEIKPAGVFVVELTRREYVTRTQDSVRLTVADEHNKLSQEFTSRI